VRPCCRRCRDGKVVSRLRFGHTPPRVSRQVYRDDVGQWADVKYDDGDEERRRPVERNPSRSLEIWRDRRRGADEADQAHQGARYGEIWGDTGRYTIKRIKALWRGRLEEERASCGL